MNQSHWPMDIHDLGGVALLGSRVERSQRRNEPGHYVHLGKRDAAVIFIQFCRDGFEVALTFGTRGGSTLYLEKAEIVGTSATPVPVRIELAAEGTISVAIHDSRQFVVRFDQDGGIAAVTLPFPPHVLKRVRLRSRASFCRTANSVAAWSIVLLRALCRCSDAGLAEVTEIQGSLVLEGLDLLSDLSNRVAPEAQPGQAQLGFPSLVLV